MTTETIRLGATDRRLNLEAVGHGIEKECPFRPGFFVTILPGLAFNSRYQRALISLGERIAAQASKKKADGAAERDSDGAAVQAVDDRFRDPLFVVEAVVAGMRGLFAADGSEVAYTPEVGIQVLADPGHADVLAWIGNEAHDYARYYTDQLRADAGNSPAGSNGNGPGAGDSERTPN